MRNAGATTALGAGLVVAGLGFGSPSLLVPGFALVIAAVLASVWSRAAVRGASIDRAPSPARVVEGDVYPMTLRLRRGIVPPPGGEIRDPLLTAPIPTGPFRPREVDLEIAMPRRGRHRLDDTTWVVQDPLGLHSRELRAPSGGELLVLPRIEPVRVAGAATMDGDGVGNASSGEDGAAAIREARAVEFEIDGVRPYREGSPASRIHWPSFARSGEMHERRILAGSEATPLIALDAEAPVSEEALDRAVRAAASLAVHIARISGCAVLLPGSRMPTTLDRRLRSWPNVHASLAMVRSGAPTRLPKRADGLRGSVFWVTAAAAGSVPRAAGSGRHYVVTAIEPEGQATFEVAGCYGVGVGSRRARREQVFA